mgnify:CR=1 FL=1
MAVGKSTFPPMHAVKGFRLGTTQANIKYENRKDLVIMEAAAGSRVAGVFTKNAFCAAPVVICRQHLAASAPRFLVINSGNANAGLGEAGMLAAKDCCAAVAELGDCSVEQVLPFSTGVIGESFPTQTLVDGLPATQTDLDTNHWLAAAEAIMTTDTIAKGISEQVSIDGHTITITGIAKGSGMIRPDMATMLAYIATDADVSSDVLDSCLRQAVDNSFNRITVDGDTSTNDACLIIETGKAGNDCITEVDSVQATTLFEAVAKVSKHLSESIIRDAEGVTRLMNIVVEQGNSESECDAVAFTVAHSPLVKTALLAGDPNWGRILAAVGRAGVSDLNIDKIQIYLDDVCIVHNGGRDSSYTEEAGQSVMQQEELTVTIKLGRGNVTTCVQTSDLSYDYVKINAEYRS